MNWHHTLRRLRLEALASLTFGDDEDQRRTCRFVLPLFRTRATAICSRSALDTPRSVSVLDQTHQRPRHYYPQVLPLMSRERLILCYVLELSALLKALALPRGIEPLFQP